MTKREPPDEPKPDAGPPRSRGPRPLQRDSVDAVNRPGPGERPRDAERPYDRLDPEGQDSGRSMEEELTLQPDEDDAGDLPHQALPNRGPEPQDEGRRVPPRRTR